MLKADERELANIMQKLQSIEEKIAKKALRSASRKAMNIVKKAAIDSAPEDSGDLKKAIKLSMKIRSNGNVYVRVGVRGGAKENPETPYYWRMVEFGTKKQRANPFMLPALENNSQAVFDTIAQELKKALAK